MQFLYLKSLLLRFGELVIVTTVVMVRFDIAHTVQERYRTPARGRSCRCVCLIRLAGVLIRSNNDQSRVAYRAQHTGVGYRQNGRGIYDDPIEQYREIAHHLLETRRA